MDLQKALPCDSASKEYVTVAIRPILTKIALRLGRFRCLLKFPNRYLLCASHKATNKDDGAGFLRKMASRDVRFVNALMAGSGRGGD